jgi:hypothetical protein
MGGKRARTVVMLTVQLGIIYSSRAENVFNVPLGQSRDARKSSELTCPAGLRLPCDQAGPNNTKNVSIIVSFCSGMERRGNSCRSHKLPAHGLQCHFSNLLLVHDDRILNHESQQTLRGTSKLCKAWLDEQGEEDTETVVVSACTPRAIGERVVAVYTFELVSKPVSVHMRLHPCCDVYGVPTAKQLLKDALYDCRAVRSQRAARAGTSNTPLDWFSVKRLFAFYRSTRQTFLTRVCSCEHISRNV